MVIGNYVPIKPIQAFPFDPDDLPEGWFCQKVKPSGGLSYFLVAPDGQKMYTDIGQVIMEITDWNFNPEEHFEQGWISEPASSFYRTYKMAT